MLSFGILLNNIIISNIVFLFILPKVKKELLSIVLSPLNPLYLPTTWGYPQDPFEKIVENLLDFLCFYSCVLDFFALLSDVISSICHSEGENFLKFSSRRISFHFSSEDELIFRTFNHQKREPLDSPFL